MFGFGGRWGVGGCWLLLLLVDVDVGVFGIGLGEDDTLVVGLLFGGINSDAMALSDPGFVGSGAQFLIGAPQRNGFCPNEDSGNFDKDLGISPEKRLLETLNSWSSGRFKSGMWPENLLPSRRRVKRWVKWPTFAGISPEKLLLERSRR